MNERLPDTFDLLPWQEPDLVATLVHEHCRANPDLSFASAIGNVAKILHERRLRQRSDRVELSRDRRKVALHEEAVRRLQHVLGDEGYYNGPSDGKPNEGTTAALEKYQRDRAPR